MAQSVTEGTVREVDAEIRTLAKARGALVARIAGLLLLLKRGRGFVALGFSTLADYAGERLSFSVRKTRELVELAEAAEALPGVRRAFESGEVPWTKLRAIARVAVPETEEEWLARAAKLSARALEQAVADDGGPAPKVRIVLELDPEQAADLEDAVRALRRERREACSRERAILELVRRGARGTGAGADARPPFQTVVHHCDACQRTSRETRFGPVPVSPATAGRARCDSEVLDGTKPGRITKTIPPGTRRFVLARDRGRCVVPGCSGRDFIEVHHVIFRSAGGDHDPAFLAVLCDAHHTAVHEGRLRMDGRAGSFRFFAADGIEIIPHAHVSIEPCATEEPARAEPALSKAATALLDALDDGAETVDDLIERANLPAGHALAAISELEIARLARRDGAFVSRYAA